MNNSFYIEPGYFEDGYIVSPCPVVLTSGPSRLDLRGPSALSGTVRLLAPEEYSTGWQRFGYPALAIVHTLALQYSRLNEAERDALDAFFDAVDFTAIPFIYIDAATGNQFPVQFQTPEISLEEAYYGLYKTALSLWSAQTFFSAPAVPTSISTLLNAAHYPEPVKRTKKQPLTRLSDGSVCIYNKSAITRTSRTCTLVRLSRDDLASLISHFISVGGMRDWWTWTVVPAVLTMEGTTNLLTANQSSVETNTVGFTADAGCTISRDTSEHLDGAASLKTIGSGAAWAGAYTAYTSVASATVYTLSLWVKGSGTVSLQLQELTSGNASIKYDVAASVVLTGTWQKVTVTATTDPTCAKVRIKLVSAVATLLTLYADCLQLEQKDHSTPFVIGTRPDTYSAPITRTCRYAASELQWQRSSVRSATYDVQVPIEEDATA